MKNKTDKLQRKPWGVYRLADIFAPDCGVRMPDGSNVFALTCRYPKTIFENLQSAWWVLSGRAEAVMWPEPGEIEIALDIITRQSEVKSVSTSLSNENPFTENELEAPAILDESPPRQSPIFGSGPYLLVLSMNSAADRDYMQTVIQIHKVDDLQKDDRNTIRSFDTIEMAEDDFLTALPCHVDKRPSWDAINKGAFQIAKQCRRGVGNVLLGSIDGLQRLGFKPDDEKLGRWVKMSKEDQAVTAYGTKGFVLGYDLVLLHNHGHADVPAVFCDGILTYKPYDSYGTSYDHAYRMSSP